MTINKRGSVHPVLSRCRRCPLFIEGAGGERHSSRTRVRVRAWELVGSGLRRQDRYVLLVIRQNYKDDIWICGTSVRGNGNKWRTMGWVCLSNRYFRLGIACTGNWKTALIHLICTASILSCLAQNLFFCLNKNRVS